MRTPRVRGAAIDSSRHAGWAQRFVGYRRPVTEEVIVSWLGSFGDHRDVGARLLDSVEYVTHDRIDEAFKAILPRLSGWSKNPARRTGKWRFVAFSTSAGESGDSMLFRFRTANGMSAACYRELFIHKSDLLREDLGPDDTVVFVDDFAGTGRQACEAWMSNLAELLPGNPRVVLLLVASSRVARRKIGSETLMRVESHRVLTTSDDLFHSSCSHFSGAEKARILELCRQADPQKPKGFGDCGFVIVFAHRCPNNSIAILHAANRRWKGLFPRN